MATINNQATLSYNGVVLTSNTTTAELQEELSLTKTAVAPTYSAQNGVTYLLSIVNNSTTTEYANLTLTDNLGAYAPSAGQTATPLTYVANSLTYYRNGVLQAAITPTEQNPLTITGISVPAGGNVLLAYEAQPNAYAPLALNSTIVNTVTMTGTGISSQTATETVTAAQAVNLNIAKAVSPTVLTDGDTVTYTFVIQNSGNNAITAADNLTVADTFTPPLQNISVTRDGVALTAGTDYTYTAATGSFTTVGGIPVPAATYTASDAGLVSVTPGVTVLTVTGTV